MQPSVELTLSMYRALGSLSGTAKIKVNYLIN